MRKLPVLLLFGCCFCRASSIGSEANVNEIFPDNSLITPCFSSLTVSGATCSGSAAVSGTSASVSYDAFGLASYGTLGAYAEGSTTLGETTSGPIPSYINIDSFGWFTDTFTITGTDTCGGAPCAATGAGTIEMQFLVTGMESSSGGAFANYCVNVVAGTSPSPDCPNLGTPFVVSQPLSIVFGEPSTFTISLDTYGHISGYNSSFTANYSDTAALLGFVVDDSNGNQLTSFNVASASGTVYPDATLPEPSAFLLVGTALPLLIFLRRRA